MNQEGYFSDVGKDVSAMPELHADNVLAYPKCCFNANPSQCLVSFEDNPLIPMDAICLLTCKFHPTPSPMLINPALQSIPAIQSIPAVNSFQSHLPSSPSTSTLLGENNATAAKRAHIFSHQQSQPAEEQLLSSSSSLSGEGSAATAKRALIFSHKQSQPACQGIPDFRPSPGL